MSKEWKKMQNDDKMKYILLAEQDRRRFLREHAIYENNKSVEKSTKYGTGRKKSSYAWRKNQLKPEYQKQVEELKKLKEQNKENDDNDNGNKENNENKENENKENINKDMENKDKENNEIINNENEDDGYYDYDSDLDDEK